LILSTGVEPESNVCPQNIDFNNMGRSRA
jgi:hypothetical protein